MLLHLIRSAQSVKLVILLLNAAVFLGYDTVVADEADKSGASSLIAKRMAPIQTVGGAHEKKAELDEFDMPRLRFGKRDDDEFEESMMPRLRFGKRQDEDDFLPRLRFGKRAPVPRPMSNQNKGGENEMVGEMGHGEQNTQLFNVERKADYEDELDHFQMPRMRFGKREMTPLKLRKGQLHKLIRF